MGPAALEIDAMQVKESIKLRCSIRCIVVVELSDRD